VAVCSSSQQCELDSTRAVSVYEIGLCTQANVSELERKPVSEIERIASALDHRVHKFKTKNKNQQGQQFKKY
jgi:hypothetical protein